MAEIFRLPKIGDAMVEAEIVEWFVAVGDEIELDQVICSVETDKSVVELSSPYRGTLLALGGEVGDVIAVGEAVLVVGAHGEAIPAEASVALTASTAAAAVVDDSAPTIVNPAAATRAADARPVVTSPLVRRLAADNDVDLASVRGTGAGGRITRSDVAGAISNGERSDPDRLVRAMPKVRKAARSAGIDLAAVDGSGPGGAVTMADLGTAREQPARRERRERLSMVRRSIAAHLTESIRTIPQFTSMVDIDAGGLLSTRQALRERLDAPVPIDAVLMALLIPVLGDHPIVNARLDGDDIVYYEHFDIGVAVDTSEGLMVPVVRDADRHSATELASEITRLAAAARQRSIQPDEMGQPTCTINNVGALGILAGTPILPLRTSTIVAFGAVRPLVQLRGGNPVEVPTMTISATFDHRLIDGGASGRFLAQLRQHLEVPALGFL